jgi:hypothetical protein
MLLVQTEVDELLKRRRRRAGGAVRWKYIFRSWRRAACHTIAVADTIVLE